MSVVCARAWHPQGYLYDLQVPQPSGPPVSITNAAGVAAKAPVMAYVSAPAISRWSLHLVPVGGWAPPWRDGLLALVAFLSVAFGALLLGLLVNRHEQALLLRDLQVR